MLSSLAVADGPACARSSYHPDLWHNPSTKGLAIEVCKTECPVRVRAGCLMESLRLNSAESENGGVWAGLSPHARQRVKTRYRNVTYTSALELVTHVL